MSHVIKFPGDPTWAAEVPDKEVSYAYCEKCGAQSWHIQIVEEADDGFYVFLECTGCGCVVNIEKPEWDLHVEGDQGDSGDIV